MHLKKYSVYVLGVRGFPGVQGGIETHCENLYPQMGKYGFDITVLARSPYYSSEQESENLSIRPIYAPTMTGVEALIHSFLGVLYTLVKRPDILHIHAIGPGLFTPLARLFGIKVVCTHHGFDYEREKWGGLSSRLLKLGEYMAAKFSSRMIAVSKLAAERLSRLYNVQVTAISNGVCIHDNYISLLPLKSELDGKKYFLSVSRIVPEKRQLDIINAFASVGSKDWKLVIVGGDGGDARYYTAVVKAAERCPNVIIAGPKSGDELHSLFCNAGAFVHASSLEGNPIVMLEAMSYGLKIIASDIPANKELALSSESYFRMGDVAHLAEKLNKITETPVERDQGAVQRSREEFSWSAKAEQTADVYFDVLGDKTS